MRQLTLSIFLLIITGCVLKPAIIPGLVPLSANLAYQLTPVPDYLVGKEQTVFVTLQSQENYTELLVVTTFEKQTIAMVFLSTEGVPLTEFTYQINGEVNSKTYVPAIEIKPAYILAKLQLMLWPIENINQSLNGANIIQKEHKRQVFKNNILIYEIDFNEQNDTFHNYLDDFTMVMTKVAS